jgi:hypothetical protein
LDVLLLSQVFGEESSHELVGFFGFGECGIVPEGVRQRFEDDQLRVNSSAEIRTVQDCGAAQEQVASAADEQGRRKTGQIRVYR